MLCVNGRGICRFDYLDVPSAEEQRFTVLEHVSVLCLLVLVSNSKETDVRAGWDG
jgi:hypothetical protein